MKNLYLFSGLGADERVFQYLNLSGYNTCSITWIHPNAKETIEDYAKRLTAQITLPNPILIGVSFGGMVAIEVAKYIHTEKIIIISSAKTRDEIPLHYKISGALRLHYLIPANFLRKPPGFFFDQFGTGNSNDRKLLADILKDTDPNFMTWAIERITSWRNTTIHANLTHIHGTDDKILPYSLIKTSMMVQQGTHFMIVSKASEVTAKVRQLLDEV